jgi:hypothetical protein
MADQTVVHLGENSPEHVAYRLFRDIAHCEGKYLSGSGSPRPDREWVLTTYAECLNAVQLPQTLVPARKR